MTVLCSVAEVSRSGYYKYLQGGAKPSGDTQLVKRIEKAQQEVRFSYGAKRMAKHLAFEESPSVNHKRIARVMQENELNARIRKKIHPEYYYRQKRAGIKATDLRLAPNVLNREFSAPGPIQKLVTDISVLNSADGWLNLSVVMDLFNNEIISHRISRDGSTALVVGTIKDLASSHDVKGILLHSDKGPTYRSYEYQDLLTSMGIVPSFSRTGNCWDNAAMESFFGHLKCELGLTVKKDRPALARKLKTDIEAYISFYNERRIQKKLGFLSPVQFREKRQRSEP